MFKALCRCHCLRGHDNSGDHGDRSDHIDSGQRKSNIHTTTTTTTTTGLEPKDLIDHSDHVDSVPVDCGDRRDHVDHSDHGDRSEQIGDNSYDNRTLNNHNDKKGHGNRKLTAHGDPGDSDQIDCGDHRDHGDSSEIEQRELSYEHELKDSGGRSNVEQGDCDKVGCQDESDSDCEMGGSHHPGGGGTSEAPVDKRQDPEGASNTGPIPTTNGHAPTTNGIVSEHTGRSSSKERTVPVDKEVANAKAFIESVKKRSLSASSSSSSSSSGSSSDDDDDDDIPTPGAGTDDMTFGNPFAEVTFEELGDGSKELDNIIASSLQQLESARAFYEQMQARVKKSD